MSPVYTREEWRLPKGGRLLRGLPEITSPG